MGPAKHHYQCYKVLVKSTRGIRIPPCVKFFPEKSKLPANSSADRILDAAKQLTHALNNPLPPTPFEHIGDEEVMALKKLAEIFNKATPKKKDKSPQRVVPREQPIQRVSTKINQNNTIQRV